MSRRTVAILFAILLAFASSCEESRPSTPEVTKSAPSGADKSSPGQGGQEAGKAAMCAEHGVPDALCTKCNPGLAQVFKAKGDWCEAHEFPESFCPVCNPDAAFPEVGEPAAGANADWCGGHGLPESKCTKCNPELIPEFKAAGDWCEEHGFPESACPTCQEAAGTPSSVGQIEGRVVRFDDPEIEERAGIATVKAVQAEGSTSVECAAELSFNADKVADIRAIVPGVVRDVQVQLGQSVEKGQPLFVLESTRIGDIQATLQTATERVRTAETNLARQRELHADEIASARQVEMAENELAAAQAEARSSRSTLRMAGAGKSGTSGRYTLRAPIDGEVVRRPGVVGVLATAEESLATVAETSTLWATCAIGERDALLVQPGHRLRLELPDGETVDGEVTWVSPEVDPRTRMVSARAEVPNNVGNLRANQFLDATVIAGAPKSAVMVPRGSVQRVEGREVVFVRAKAGTYLPRVVVRHGDGETVAVEGKVKAGDDVVTDGAVLLRTEVLPNSIGAGCCEVEPPSSED